MKIKTRLMDYEKVMALPRPAHQNPLKPHPVFRGLIRLLSIPSLWKARFDFDCQGMEKVGNQPCLILMNHSCFMDLKIAYRIFYPRPMCIVGTTDSLIGKKWLMRLIGIIPTQKFVSDLTLIRDMRYALTQLKCSVLMFPEAGYTLDGRATRLPRHLGVILKRMNVPVVTVTTYGAFARDPLYNGLQLRKVKVFAQVKCLLTPEEIQQKSLEELDEMVEKAFAFDQFAWQRDNRVKVREPFRADGLERVLYQCPHCLTEGKMKGEGVQLTCGHCGKTYEMDEMGQMKALQGETEFAHIPHWFDWQRRQVKEQIDSGRYHLDVPVDVAMLVDHKALYRVGAGRLTHSAQGFLLKGCDGRLAYAHSPLASHTLNVDYFWYSIGDMISFGNKEALYFCFPPAGVPVTKARLAAEILYDQNRGG